MLTPGRGGKVPLLMLALLAAAVMAGAAVHQKRLLALRGTSKDQFIQEFADHMASTEVASAVYDYYQGQSNASSFEVSPEFSLTTVFRKSHEDIDDDVREILSGLGLHLPPEAVLRGWPKPLSTVRDVVDWVDWVKGKQSSP